MPDATSLHHCLKKQAAKIKMLSAIRVQQNEYLILYTLSRVVANTCI